MGRAQARARAEARAGLKLADAGGSMVAWFFVFVDLDMGK